MTEESKITE